MRIAFVVLGPCPPAIEEAAIALGRARHVVRLFTDGLPEGPGRRADGLDRVAVGEPGAHRGSELERGLQARELAAALRAWEPDIVHAVGFAAGVVAQRAVHDRVPVVISVPRLAATQRRLGDASTALAARMLVERRVLDRSAMVIADSSGQAMELLRAGVRPAGIVTLAPGVDWRRYPVTPLPQRGAQRAWSLLHPGGSAPDSGVEDAMAAVSGMKDAHLTIVGARRADAGRLEEAIRRWRLRERVTVHPRVPASAMPGMYVAADAVIVPPRQLSSGRLVLEALSAGRPVVATACGGIVDIVEEAATGFLAPPRDPGALADAVGEAMTAARSALEDMTALAVTQIRRDHAWQQRLPSLVSIYASVADGERGQASAVPALLPA